MTIIVGFAAFLAMEPLAALAHRFLMHGRGYGWHASHHAAPTRGWEANDGFPLVFALVTVSAIALGSVVPALSILRAIGAGVTAYGAAYVLIHDVCVHGRLLGRPVGGNVYVRHVRRAHRVHHLSGGAPYGFLAPIMTRRARPRPESTRRDASGRPIAAVAATRTFRVPGTDARRENTS